MIKIGAVYRHIDHDCKYGNARRQVLDIAEDLSEVQYLYWEHPNKQAAMLLSASMKEFLYAIEEVKA